MVEYYVGPDNSAPLVGITAGLCAVTCCLGMWRFSYRAWKGVFGLSDYLLCFALILATSQAIFNISACTIWGYGRHKEDLPPHIRNSPTPKLLFFINQVFFKVETGMTKMSICVIYIRIFRHAVARRVRIAQIVNYVLAFVIAVYYFVGSFVSLLQCKPIRKAWLAETPGTCIDNDLFRLANGYINVLTSAWIIIMPFPVLLAVEHRKKELWEFLGLVALGAVHTCCAIWRVQLMYKPAPQGKPDPQWNNTTANILAVIEEFVGIIAATIIVMRPCFHICYKGVTGIGTALISSTRGTATASATVKRSRIASVTPSSRNHYDGFTKLRLPKDLELQSRKKGTEEVWREEINMA